MRIDNARFTGSVDGSQAIATLSGSFTGSGHIELSNTASYNFASASISASNLILWRGSGATGQTSSLAIISQTSDTASYVSSSNVDGPFGMDSIQTASYAVSASHVEFADSSSYAVTSSHSVTASYAISASHVEFADSASYAVTSSHAISASHLIGLVEDAFSATFTAATTFTVTHGLNTNDVIVQVYDTVTGGITRQFIPNIVEVVGVNQVDLTFAVPTTGYVVVSAGGYLQSGSLQNAQTASYVQRVNNTLDQGLGIENFSYDGGTAGVIVQLDTSSAHFLSSSVATSSLALTASFIAGQSYDEAVTSGVGATFNIVHNLDSTFPIVASYDAANQQVIPDTVEIISVNQVDVTFAGAFTGNIVVKK